jgi:uridine kinase
MPQYDFVTKSISSYKIVKPADVIIVEGILSLYNEQIKNYGDLKIYVDVPDDERLIRRILRDKKSRNANIEKTIEM